MSFHDILQLIGSSPPVIPADPAIDPAIRLLDRYKAKRILGVGGSAVVVLADDLVLGRTVAIKFWFDPEDRYSAVPLGAQGLFLEEARTLARLVHPHICAVYDYGVDEDLPWIVLEYFTDESLRHLASRRQTGQAGDRRELVLDLMIQVVSAVATLHDNGYSQLDLKPDNVLVDTKIRLAKIVDVGSPVRSRHPGDPVGSIRATEWRSTRSATPGYAAPEILDSSLTQKGTSGVLASQNIYPHIDFRGSDVFSLGAMLLELLVGDNALNEADFRSRLYDAIGVKERDFYMRYATAGSRRGKVAGRPGWRYQLTSYAR
jgi:serine/threonine protein kinase